MKKYISVLGVIATLAVVFLHANGCFWDFNYESNWLSANAIECICYFAVPIFFMISGANLIDYRERYDTKTYFIKRIQKTLIPFLIWSAVGCLYQIWMGNITMENLSVGSFFTEMLNTGFVDIYWFFIPLFAVYLCIPALAMIPKKSREPIFRYLLWACFIVNILVPFLSNAFSFDWNRALSIEMMGGYMFYVLAGYYFDHYTVSKKFRIWIYVFGVVGLLAHYFGTLAYSYQAGEINGLFKNYVNVPCVLYSLAIFVFFKYADSSKVMNGISKVTSFFSNATYGVYLTHWYLLDMILHFTDISPWSFVYRIGGGIVVFLVATLITKLIKKIPILKLAMP